jgi:nitroreductase
MKKVIHKSQHCQRNWDLSKEIPQEDIDTMLEAVTQCPSKQNKAFYKVHFITNRDVIEKAHANTVGFGNYLTINENTAKFQPQTNSQVLANLLVVFEKYSEDNVQQHPNPEFEFDTDAVEAQDRNTAIGIAAGYLNLTGSLLGYSTGCCGCFQPQKMQEVLGLDNEPLLLMGVGYSDETKNRRIHHADSSFKFPTIKKTPIPVNIVE